jgi:iron(III) transport system substrate-binding protein
MLLKGTATKGLCVNRSRVGMMACLRSHAVASYFVVCFLQTVATLAAAQSPGIVTEPQWAELIAAAKQEGTVAIASGGAPSRQYRPVIQAFQRKFDIRTQISTGNANDTTNRVLAERQAGRRTADLALLSVRTNNARLIPAGALVPISPLLMLPEVTDLTLWHGGRHWYGDERSTYVFIYHASADSTYATWYNSEKVSEDELRTLKSQWDIFHPRWKGRLLGPAMTDPSGIRQMSDSWLAQDRGPEWVRRYLLEAGVTFSSDRRILENWLAGGRFHVWPVKQSSEGLIDLQKNGLPVAQLDLPMAKPILRTSGSGCCISVFEGAPHPNAAKLFLNWFLSKEGQALTHSSIPNLDRASLRNDIPWGEVLKDQIRSPDKQYDFPDAEPDYNARLIQAETEVMKIWESRQQ